MNNKNEDMGYENYLSRFEKETFEKGKNWQKEQDEIIIESLIASLKECSDNHDKLIEALKRIYSSHCEESFATRSEQKADLEAAKQLLQSIEKETL